jgi:hypothetical protein
MQLARCLTQHCTRNLARSALAQRFSVRTLATTAPALAPAASSAAPRVRSAAVKRRPKLPRPYIPLKPLTARQVAQMAAANVSPAAQLRALLAKNDLAAYIVPTADAHQVRDPTDRRQGAPNGCHNSPAELIGCYCLL